MRSFEYNGEIYRSMNEACKALGISYQKVRRICRHYVKASKDPAVAIEWILSKHKLCREQKTWKYVDDLEKTLIRVQRLRDKRQQKILEIF